MTPPEDTDARDSKVEEADRAMSALRPAPLLAPAFSAKVLRAARVELATSQTRYQRTERLLTRVIVPAALVASAIGWMYHVAHIAERVFALGGN